MLSHYRYVANNEWYVDCPTCDGTSDHGLEFFDSIKQFLDYNLKHHGTLAENTLYSTMTGKSVCIVEHLTGEHQLGRAFFHFNASKYMTMDNGHGKLVIAKCE